MPPAHRLCRGDDGAGLVGTLSGFLAFLVFLLFATQLLLGLFARSTASAVAFDGARVVAEQGALHDGPLVLAEAEAEGRMRQLLGRAGTEAAFDWTGTDADWVVVRVTMPAPRIGWPGFTSAPAVIDRTARVRVEALR